VTISSPYSSKARDPDIRRIAQEAETRLINDPQSAYRQWPHEPPPGPPPGPQAPMTNGQPPPSTARNHLSPTPTADLAEDLGPASPTPDFDQPAESSAPLSPQDPGSSVPPAANVHYASPYGQPSTSYPNHSPAVTSASTHAVPPSNSSTPNNVPSQHTYPQAGPPLQPAAPAGVVLSRTRETKILLSIDGDGIRGLSALLLIESLVNAICVKIGQRLDPHQIFDLTGGSSLGGVIAILLCRLQMQAHRAREAYKRISRQVYLNKRDFFVSLDPHAPLPHSDGTALENEIKAVIQQELGTQDERLFDGREGSGDV
jgi:hypothetical protein